MVGELDEKVQRGHNYVIVDEIDSILIDEARTPLIISGAAEETTEWYNTFAEVAKAVIKFHGKGEVETIPFPEHLKSRYQEYTQADLTKLRATGYDKPFKTVAEGVAEYMAWLNRR